MLRTSISDMLLIQSRVRIMKKLILTLAGVLLASASAAQAINESLDASGDGTVYVSNTAGSVEVDGWSRNEVEITGNLGRNVEELQFERDGDDIVIKVKVRRNNSHSISTKLVIKVPEDSSMEVHTVSADIDIDNVMGEQRLESVSGDIVTAAHASDIEAETVSGDVEVQGDGKMMRSRLNSVSGDVDVDNLSGEISAESVSGDVTIRNGAFERAFANTVNGEIVFHAGLLSDGRLEVETINGEVDVRLNGKVSARFDLETFNGDIRNCFGPDAVRTSKYTPGVELKFTEGSGDGRVSIETLNGNIRLCK